MSRLPLMTYADADAAQRELWDYIIESRGKGALSLVDDDGGLRGPFPAMIRRPHIGSHLIQAGAAVRFESSLTPDLLELAITTVGARWRSEFEFWAHGRMALDAGVDQAVLDALIAGTEPDLETEQERAVYRFARTLSLEGRVDAPTYDAAVAALGVDSVVDLTQTIGYYTQICFILNTFEAALPPGVSPAWQ